MKVINKRLPSLFKKGEGGVFCHQEKYMAKELPALSEAVLAQVQKVAKIE